MGMGFKFIAILIHIQYFQCHCTGKGVKDPRNGVKVYSVQVNRCTCVPAGVLAEVRLRHVHDPQPHEAVVVRGGALHHARDKLVLPEDKSTKNICRLLKIFNHSS